MYETHTIVGYVGNKPELKLLSDGTAVTNFNVTVLTRKGQTVLYNFQKRTCWTCGKRLPPEATARRKFCDAKCRVAYHRQADAQQAYNAGMDAIRSLGNAKTKRDKQKAIETLKALKQQIHHELRVLGDYDTVKLLEMRESRRRGKAENS